MQLTLELPDGFCVPPLVAAASADDAALVLTLGQKYLHALHALTQTEGEAGALRERLGGMSAMAEEMVQQLKDEAQAREADVRREAAERARLEFEARERCYAQTIAEQKGSLELLRHELERARADRQQLGEQMAHANRALSEQLATIQTKLPHANLRAIGAIGEEHARRVIEDTLDACDVQRMAEHGDLLLTTPAGLRCLVEVKSVERVEKERDLDKFGRDRQKHLESGGNAALFVSLRASIPNHKNGMRFESDASGLRCPVIYVNACSEEVLRLAVRAVEYAHQLCKHEHLAAGSQPIPDELVRCREEREALRAALPALFQHREGLLEDLNLQLEFHDRSKGITEAAIAKLQFESGLLGELRQKVAWLFSDDEAGAVPFERAVAIYEAWMDANGNKHPPNLRAFGADQIVIARAGITHVKAAIAERRRGRKQAYKRSRAAMSAGEPDAADEAAEP